MPTKTGRKFRLADVDGTVPGVAMLVTADLSRGLEARPMHQTWVEKPDDTTDPYHGLLALWESIESDWPGHEYTIIVNERARYLMAQERMRQLLGEDSVSTPRRYWEENA